MKWELVFYNNYDLLESPVWDGEHKILYCVAIRDHHVIGISLNTKIIRIYDTGSVVGCVALMKDGNLLIAKKEGIYKLFVGDGAMEFICQPVSDAKMRFNDGKWDPRGRFLVGSMGDLCRMEKEGCVYSVEGKNYRKIITGTTVANGMGFSGDGKIFYHIDTPEKTVMKYDYNPETGDLSNPKTAVRLEGAGSPDGMFVLPDETLLVCEWGGGCVSRWDGATGTLIETYQLPVTNVTCCCLGGKSMNELYITTAKCKDKTDEFLAGGVFKIDLSETFIGNDG